VPGEGLDTRTTAVMILIALVAGVAGQLRSPSRDLRLATAAVACSIPTDHLRAVTQPGLAGRVLRAFTSGGLGLVPGRPGLPSWDRFCVLDENGHPAAHVDSGADPVFRRLRAGPAVLVIPRLFWLNTAELAVAAFAIAQVARWSAEDQTAGSRSFQPAPSRASLSSSERSCLHLEPPSSRA